MCCAFGKNLCELPSDVGGLRSEPVFNLRQIEKVLCCKSVSISIDWLIRTIRQTNKKRVFLWSNCLAWLPQKKEGGWFN